MSLFKNLFGGGKKGRSDGTKEIRGIHMPDVEIPVDEKFTIQFNKNGGKFLYCDSFSEVLDTFRNIIKENNWEKESFFVVDNKLKNKFSRENLKFTDNSRNGHIFFTTCEHLIAQNGSILVCSNQIQEKKLYELPENFIVYATTSQLADSIGEGLKNIKRKYRNSIPTNITTIKNFQSAKDKKEDFLTYGSSSKNLYLLLLEDL